MREDATTQEINKLKNNIVKVGGKENIFSFDVRQFNKLLQKYLIILYMMSGLISIILFVLTFFQLVVSISGNLRDDAWELGVLR